MHLAAGQQVVLVWNLLPPFVGPFGAPMLIYNGPRPTSIFSTVSGVSCPSLRVFETDLWAGSRGTLLPLHTLDLHFVRLRQKEDVCGRYTGLSHEIETVDDKLLQPTAFQFSGLEWVV